MLVRNNYDGCYEGDEPALEMKEISLQELLASKDYEIQADLKRAGWVNKNKIEEREERIKVMKRFFHSNYGKLPLVRRSKKGSSVPFVYHYPTLQEIDLEQAYFLNWLAQGNILLQEIALESLPAETYEQIMSIRKEIEKYQKEKEKKAKARREKRKVEK